MDIQLRKEIRKDVIAVMREILTEAEEKYITAQELSNQFAMFKPKWVRQYGHLLPRKKVSVTEIRNDGQTVVSTHWAYPQHEIALGIKDGRFENLAIYVCEGGITEE